MAGLGRKVLLPLVVFLSLLYILIACLSGYLFNRQADNKTFLGEDALSRLDFQVFIQWRGTTVECSTWMRSWRFASLVIMAV